MLSLRFLQVSDLHLDSSLAGSRLGLSPAKRARINRDIEAGLRRALEIAREENVDVVLLPGDLWDDESVSFQTATMVYDTLASLAPIPVLIAPGNHDPYHAFSYHHAGYFKNKVGRPHPRNVTVFSSPKFERRTLSALPDVDFYGCCFEQNVPPTERALAGLKPERDNVLNVLLLHGSQDDAMVANWARLGAAPFSRAELLATGFDYTALGHYHRFSQITDDHGMIRGAYGGIPVARTLEEDGERYVLVGEITEGGIRPETLKHIAVDTRRIRRIEVGVDATVTNSAAARERVEAQLKSAGVTPEDIIYLELTGRTHPEITTFDFDPAWRDAQCFHLAIDQSRLEPEYDIDALLADETARKRVEGQFAERMRQLLAAAEGDTVRQRTLRAAMVHGLDALNGREVRLRRVH
ncbi:MAG: DNA repair exonuclease [Candidatus Sumerlaeaceae bacterium]|nr:DNA repair exonuclease [Candidatus Sumerlaeaceae bacterium]